jgi:choline dehydrogenase-like flavoprotein
MIYVVGSGPAAMACAVALAERGRPVTILDAGVTLEEDRDALVQRLGEHPPEAWDAVAPGWQGAWKRNDLSRYDEGGPAKAVYGSYFPYREAERVIDPRANRSALWPSLALGGFSNVWGGAVLPYLEADTTDWPVSQKELAPHYATVLQLMPFSAQHDGLERFFPLYSEAPMWIEPSGQATALLADLHINREALEAEGVHHGRSRLAVRGRPAAPSAAADADDFRANGCLYCGLCLYGCPYHFIYNSTATLRRLRCDSQVQYVPSVVVTRLEERPGGVRIHGVDRRNGSPQRFDGDAVFLACGVLATAQILLNAMGGETGRQVTVLDSQYFYLPWLRYRGVPGLARERMHTLAQVFLEIWDRALSKRTIHLQVYTFNDLYVAALRSRLGPLYALAGPLARALLSRLLMIQGYLHSEVSSRLVLRLVRERGQDMGRLHLDVVINPEAERIVRGLCDKLARLSGFMRAYPLTLQLALGRPGRGAHCGGSFPMRERPREGETDRLGVPHGFRRVHLVDASVFPSIPATTITLTTMANAHRIAMHFLES